MKVLWTSWFHPSILQLVSRESDLQKLTNSPHHPGVLQTEVLVKDEVDEVGLDVVVVVVEVEP